LHGLGIFFTMTKQFQLNFFAKQNVDLVFDCLSDMQWFCKVHPLMLSIEKVEGNTYKVRERLKWSFLPFSFTYTFNCFVDEEKSEVRFEATIMKFTRMVLCFSLVPSEGGTRIQEQVSLRSPLPIHGFMQGLLKEQHAILFQQIEKQKSSDRPGLG
jgi:hypothetical protein